MVSCLDCRFAENKSLMASKDSKRIVRTYNRVAMALIEFETLWIQAWIKSIEAAKAGLQTTLITKHPTTGQALCSGASAACLWVVRSFLWIVRSFLWVVRSVGSSPIHVYAVTATSVSKSMHSADSGSVLVLCIASLRTCVLYCRPAACQL